MQSGSGVCRDCRGQLFKTIPHKCVERHEMDPARFRELVKRKDSAKKVFDETAEAMAAAKGAYDAAAHQWSEACNNLQDYVQECAGDPSLGSYRR